MQQSDITLALQLPIDYPIQNRTFRMVSHPPIRLNIPVAEGENKQSFLIASYIVWLHRMTNESEVSSVIVLNRRKIIITADFTQIVVFSDVEHIVRTQLNTPHLVGNIKADMIFGIGNELEYSHESVLCLNVYQMNGSYHLQIAYDESLIQQSTVNRYVEYFSRVLEAVTKEKEIDVKDFSIISVDDLAIYRNLNATEFDFPMNTTIHQMFENAVDAYPVRTALEFEGTQLTYRQLNEQANQVAHGLLKGGIQKGDFVTIFVDRSLETVVSILGVLKAGGVYVPVDPSHPQERNIYILRDTNSPIIITNNQYFENVKKLKLQLSTIRMIVNLDSDLTDLPIENPLIDVSATDLAYVIYTSGSTGLPKGTLLKHQGVLNLGFSFQKLFHVSEKDVMAQFASFSFDATVWEMFGTLFFGAKLYMLSFEERLSADEFLDAIERIKITIIPSLPTVFFNQLAQQSSQKIHQLSMLRYMNVAGEALYGEHVRKFQNHFKNHIVISNLYGPTEATVCTTAYQIDTKIPDDVYNIPIGKPIGNYKVYVVNEKYQLCPPSVPGELLIASVGLAKEYYHQPERTEQAFIQNPLNPTERVYRSGDIVRLLKNGNLEYLSRKDSQVKIRGHRVEIGEIEDKLATIEKVKDVAVVVQKDIAGQKILVGFFTTKDGAALPTKQMKDFLSKKLPSYFIPTHFVHVSEMPISPTGKIDRKRLATFEYKEEHSNNERSFESPRTDLERIIATAWEEGLQFSPIGIQDNFFEIGGTSLKIIDVLTRLKPKYPGLKIMDFYNFPTISDLSSRVETMSTHSKLPGKVDVSVNKSIKLHEFPLAFGNSKNTGFVEFKQILLTGCTGYLGSHILYDILRSTHANVHCLVRRSGDKSGYQRLLETLAFYFGEEFTRQIETRVMVIEGELGEPGLGLSKSDRESIVSVDTIIHCAADVRHFGDNEQFMLTNVTGTKNLVDLAMSMPGIRFNHISTVGILEDLALCGKWEDMNEQKEFPMDLQLENVYTNSKLQAEQLLYAAARKGLAVSIYRVGNLVGHSKTGRFQKNVDSNAFYRMIKAMVLLEKAPLANWLVDITPIDYASRAIVSLAQDENAMNHVFHVCNPNPIEYSRFIEILRQLGYNIECQDMDSYVKWLLSDHTVKKLEGVQLAITQLEGDGAKDSPYQFGCEQTQKFLGNTDVTCPKINFELVRKMVTHSINIGFLPKARVMVEL